MKKNYSLSNFPLFWLAVFCIVAVLNTSISAQGFAVLEPPMTFKTDIEPSAVEPIGNGEFLLVANDKHDELFIVDAKRAVIVGDKLSLLSANRDNPKWEAMAKDGEDYYIYGRGCLCLVRFSLKGETATDPANISIREKKEFPVENGFGGYIEGLAIWTNNEKKKELVFGIREIPGKNPIRICRATIELLNVRSGNEKPDARAAATQTETSGDNLKLKEFFAFNTEKTQKVEWHISSIEYVQVLDGFLIVTSTEKNDRSNEFYGNKLWFVSREKLKGIQKSSSTGTFNDATTVMKDDGNVFEKKMKAEGLAILPTNDKAKLEAVIVFDNDYVMTQKIAKLALADLSKLLPIKSVPVKIP